MCVGFGYGNAWKYEFGAEKSSVICQDQTLQEDGLVYMLILEYFKEYVFRIGLVQALETNYQFYLSRDSAFNKNIRTQFNK